MQNVEQGKEQMKKISLPGCVQAFVVVNFSVKGDELKLQLDKDFVQDGIPSKFWWNISSIRSLDKTVAVTLVKQVYDVLHLRGPYEC